MTVDAIVVRDVATENESPASIPKSIVVRLLVALPVRCWPLASRLVNAVWPGFRGA